MPFISNPEYIQQLALESGQAASVSSALLCAFEGMNDQSMNDVCESMLLGQLASNKKYDPRYQCDDWNHQLSSISEKLGWLVQSPQSDWVEVPTETKLSKWAIETIQRSSSQLGAVKAAVDAVGNSSNSDAARTLTNQSQVPFIPSFYTNHDRSSTGKFNILIATCKNDGSNNVIMELHQFVGSAPGIENNVLETKLKSGTKVAYYSWGNLILNTQIYAMMRDAVQQKLGSMREEHIKPVTL